ncbi:MAG: polyprenyl synthetase family protein [Bacteroidales bacterium]|nr:polyprenyl synthetase family protein [Bacteroidales bacterium]
MDQLTLIRKPIEQDLERYLSFYEKDFTHQNPLLHLALQHIRKRQGKRLRPIVTLLAARCFGAVDEAVLHASVGIELVHTASLVHDDIVDESDMRRGQVSVNKLMSPQAAVLVGDYLLARSLYHSSGTGNLEVVDLIAKVTEMLSDGELLQLYTLDSDRVEESVYYDVIRRKTAVLFSTSAQIGALLGGATREQQEALRLFGEYVGIAFQIRDDILDYEGDEALGKPTGNDMKEGKLTLPAIYALNQLKGDAVGTNDSCVCTTNGTVKGGEELDFDEIVVGAPENNKPRMLDIALRVRRCEASAEEIKELVSFTVEQGGLQYATQEMVRYSELAIEQISLLPKSEFTDALCEFARLAVRRNH